MSLLRFTKKFNYSRRAILQLLDVGLNATSYVERPKNAGFVERADSPSIVIDFQQWYFTHSDKQAIIKRETVVELFDKMQ